MQFCVEEALMEALDLYEAGLQEAAGDEQRSADAIAQSEARLQKILEAG